MPISTKKKKMELRRIEIAKWFAQGLNQFEIAEKVGVERSTVSRDLKTLEQRWKAEAVDEIAKLKARELIKINNIEREAYEAWENSKAEKIIKSKKQSGGQESGRTEVAVRTESIFGEKKYLDAIQWCIDKRCKLLGLDAPIAITGKIENENTDKLKKVVDKMSDEERKTFFEIVEKNNGVS